MRSTRGQWRLIPSIGVLCVAILGSVSPVAAAGGSSRTWKEVAVPSPRGAFFPEIEGVSCASRSSCLAIGSYERLADSTESSYFEHWNGSRWSVADGRVRRTDLTSVSCFSSRECMTVGGAAYLWTSGSWQRQSVERSARLFGVSCPSVNVCFAVGYAAKTAGGQRTPLAERWDGSTWKPSRISGVPVSKSPRFRLDSIDCRSARRCVAVGGTRNQAGHRVIVSALMKGKTWKAVAVPYPKRVRKTVSGADLISRGVSCPTAHMCMADVEYLGFSGDAVVQGSIVERFDGHRWHLLHYLPAAHSVDTNIYGLACPKARDCVATGAYDSTTNTRNEPSLVEHWNGKRWSIEKTSLGNKIIGPTSCVSRAFCMSIGDKERSGSFGAIRTSVAGG
jgi:hypothetical protein